MASLYEISGKYADIVAMLETAETEEEFEVGMQVLASVSDDLTDKADAYARVMRNYAAEAEAFKAEAKRLTEHAKRCETICERMKRGMLDAMKTTGTVKLPVSVGTWAVRMNPPSVAVDDEAAVPEDYAKYTRTLDKRAILAALKAGAEIPGAHLERLEGVRLQ